MNTFVGNSLATEQFTPICLQLASFFRSFDLNLAWDLLSQRHETAKAHDASERCVQFYACSELTKVFMGSAAVDICRKAYKRPPEWYEREHSWLAAAARTPWMSFMSTATDMQLRESIIVKRSRHTKPRRTKKLNAPAGVFCDN